jgi:biopolymer transport protein ExbB/TolQ
MDASTPAVNATAAPSMAVPADPAAAVLLPDAGALTQAAGAGHELTITGLFLQADIVVKAVMLLLVVASIATWAIAFEKSRRLARIKRDVEALEAGVAARRGLSALDGVDGIPRAALEAGATEWRVLAGEDDSERRMRTEQAMRLSVTEQLRDVERGLAYLATVGSSAPFIGLFGTVWGILNSFTSIANRADTSLAVVAPGIAEALFATAIGLVAAIPAVMWYNAFSTQLGRIGARLSTAIARLASQIGRKDVASATRQAAE